MNTTQDPAQMFGYEVIDQDGEKIGEVDNVWVDDATNELEFIGVKTGWIFGSTHIIPTANAQIGEGSIQVPYPSQQVKDAPSFGADDELSPEDEEQVYAYYGLARSTAPSPSGEAAGYRTTSGTSERDLATTGTTGYQSTAGYGEDTTTNRDYGTEDERSVRLHEEELQVGTRPVEAGQVRLRKVVHTERQEVPVELRREDVEIERVAVSDGDIASDAFEEAEIEVPVMREEAVVGKEVRATGEVRLNKDVETETRTVGGEVRSEEVEIDRDVDPSGVTDTIDKTEHDTRY